MHSLIHIDSIVIPDYRQRALIDDISIIELAKSIEEQDLLHAITIRATNPPTLVAGGRRLQAIKLLRRTGRKFKYAGQPVTEGFIPVTRLTEREEVEYLEAEYYENMERLDLTWQEQSLARVKLHELRSKQNPEQTLTDTAKEITGTVNPTAYSRTSLSDDIAITKHFNDPSIAKAKTKQEAKKLLDIKFREERFRNFAAEDILPSDQYKLILGDAVEELKKYTSAFKVILTDPPYGIGADTFGNQTAINHHYDDSLDAWIELMVKFSYASYDACTKEAHAYLFCDINRWHALAEIMKEANWKVWPRPLIWAKGNIGTLPRPNHGPRYTYEAILFASKGDMPIQKVGAHDVLFYPSTAKPLHAAEKPVDLYVDLLSRSVCPGDNIIDPFCGSGTVFAAAVKTACFATGIELNLASYGIAKARLQEIVNA